MTIRPAHSDRASAGKTNPAAALPAQKSGTPGTASPLLRADDFVPATPGEPAFPRVIVVAAAPTRLDALNPEVLWRFTTRGEKLCCPAPSPDGGVLFVPTRADSTYALDAKTGKEMWRAQIGGLDQPKLSPDGSILYTTSDGMVHALKTQTGEKIWQSQCETWNWPQLSANGSILYTAKGGKLHALDAKTGREIWRFKGELWNWPALSPDASILYAGSNTGNIHALNAKTGKEIWQSKGRWWDCPTPSPDGSVLYVPTGAGHVCSLDAKAGKEIRQLATEKLILPWPIVSPDGTTLYVRSRDADTVCALDTTTGKEIWNFQGGTGFPLKLSPDGTTLYVRKDAGVFCAIESSTGKKIWQLATEKLVLSSQEMSSDGTKLYVVKDETLYAFPVKPESTRSQRKWIIATEIPEGVVDIGGFHLPGPSY